jgi:hypothetical protein
MSRVILSKSQTKWSLRMSAIGPTLSRYGALEAPAIQSIADVIFPRKNGQG